MKHSISPRLFAACIALVALALSGVAVPITISHLSSGKIHNSYEHESLGLKALNGDPDAISIPTREGSPLSLNSWQQEQRAFPQADIPPAGYARGQAEANQVKEVASTFNWRELGPLYAPKANSTNPKTGASSAVSGRTTAVAVVPSTCSGGQCGTIYVGAAYGGVWKSTDAGQTWRPILDRQLSTAIGTITLDPKDPNIVYVGTGEPNHSGDSHRGVGVLRSIDAGQTWTNLGYKEFVNRGIGTLIVDPRTAGSTHATLYAVSTRAASGGAETGGGNARTNPFLPGVGFHVSTDGGATWTLSNPDGAFEGAQSLVMDPTNPNVLYAGFEPDPQAHADKPNDTTFYAGDGIYKSADDGTTWTHLTDGLPSLYYDTITLAVAPSDPRVLYASYDIAPPSLFNAAPFGATNHQAMYKSTDAGNTWTNLANAPDACADQCSYDSPLAVDPTDSRVLYAGGSANYGYLDGQDPECRTLDPLPKTCHASVMKSVDGGATWADVGENAGGGPIHPDDHAIIIAPNDHAIVYTADDGGLFHSANAASTWSDLNKGLGTLQFTGLAVSPNGDIYAGTQDNGTFKYSGSTTWEHITPGDGGPTAADPKNAQVIYHSLYGPFLFKNTAAGDPSKDVFIASFAGDLLVKGLGQFYEPYVLAPSKPNTMFYGTYRLWRSNLAGGIDGNNDGDATNDPSDKDDWVPISFDLRCASQPRDPTATCSGAPAAGHGIASIAVSPTNPNIVAAGSSNGLVWLTSNALAPVKTDSNCTPWTNIRGVALCDYLKGPSWHHIDAQLPQRYPTSLKFAPRSSTTLYVTLSGFDQTTKGHPGHAFVSFDSGRHWRNLNGTGRGSTLPDLPFNDIVVNPQNGHLYAAADYGGIFVSKDGGHTWRRMDRGLPSAPIYQMEYTTRGHALFVATHGRGIWKVTAP
ncbi:MAG: WD40/YVTN/BNR-like repeat-containing protein [Chloroflexota bacterium]